MLNVDGSSLLGLLAAPLTLPASIAGALAALFVVLLLLVARRGGAGARRRLILPIALMLLAGLATAAVLDRMASNERGAERRALAQRDAELTAQALTSGSPLACLDSAAGEMVENDCEHAVFASPQSTAGAVAYTAARLTLLADALALAHRGHRRIAETFAGMRRAIELDRYGIAARVLAVRDGCTADHCGAFALLDDTSVIKANLKAQIFSQYVSRHSGSWNKATPVATMPPPVAPAAPAVSMAEPPPGRGPVDSRYDFPSAATIPPVSIMNAEPALPKEPAGNAGSPPAAAPSVAAPAAAESAVPEARLPLPPKRPQIEAAAPPAR